jgi:ClpP class serine protease
MRDLAGVLAAIRAQPWAILPEYLEAIEALAARAMDAGALQQVAADGHEARLREHLDAVAAVGMPLEGARLSTVRDGVAVVPLLGPVFPRANLINSSAGGTPLDAVMRDFRVAQASTAVDRVVLLVDSPGGVVSGLGEAAEGIRSAQKPVTAFVTGMAASAAYWLASQASEIVVEPAGSVGSIGVVATLTRQEAAGADGRRAYEVVSSNAPNKRPDPSSEEGRAAIQQEVDALEAVFIGAVAKGRGVPVSVVRSEFGRGAMVAAAAAVERGMADRIGTLESVLRGTRRTGEGKGGGRRALAAAEIETRRRAADRS